MNTWKRGFPGLLFPVIPPVYCSVTQTCKRCPTSSCKGNSRCLQEALIHPTIRKKNVHWKCFSSSCNSACITFADWFQTCSVASGCSMSLGQERRIEMGTLWGASGEGRQKRKTAEKRARILCPVWVLGWARICSVRQLCHSSSSAVTLCFSSNLSKFS